MAPCGGAQRDRLDLGVAQRSGGVGGVRRRGDEVEGGVGAGEGDLAAAADVEPVEVLELELLPVDEDVAGLPDVDDAELAALEVATSTPSTSQAGSSSSLGAGNRSADDQPVVVRVDAVDLARRGTGPRRGSSPAGPQWSPSPRSDGDVEYRTWITYCAPRYRELCSVYVN